MSWRDEDRERGASAVEMAMLTPLLVLLIMLVVQFAMYYHAQHIAVAAAQAGARVARTEAADHPTTWGPEASAKADEYIQKLGPKLIVGARTTVIDEGRRPGDPRAQVGVEVRATAVRVVPFLTIPIQARSLGPVEAFDPDTP